MVKMVLSYREWSRSTLMRKGIKEEFAWYWRFAGWWLMTRRSTLYLIAFATEHAIFVLAHYSSQVLN
jgi:hypothetical protein